jgi:hypothetical protein
MTALAPARDRVSDLDEEEAAAAADERDGAAFEGVEIGALAATRLRFGVDRLYAGLYVAAARVAQRDEVVAVGVGRRLRCRTLELRLLELTDVRVTKPLQTRLIAGLAQLADDVSDRSFVSGGARGARAAVLVGDSLQLGEIHPQPLLGDCLRDGLRRRARPGRGRLAPLVASPAAGGEEPHRRSECEEGTHTASDDWASRKIDLACRAWRP